MSSTKLKCYTLKRKNNTNYTTCNDDAQPKAKKKVKFVIKKKKEEPPKPKKKIKFVVKPKKVELAKKKTAGEKLTGLTKEEMNKLSPEELFGKLPVELRKKTLTSGIKVAKEKFTVKDIMDLVRRFQLATKSSAYSKISQRQIDIFEKYSDLERFTISDEEFKDKLEKMNTELGAPFKYNNISYNSNKEMKNFKKDVELMFDINMGRYYYSKGSAYALLQDVRIMQRVLDNPTSERQKKFKEKFLKKFDEKFEKPKKKEKSKEPTQKQIENEAKKIKIKKYLEDQPKTKRYPKNSSYIEGPYNKWYYSYRHQYLVKNILDKSVEVEIEGGTSMSESDRDEIGKIKKIPLLTFASQVGIDNSDLFHY